jgi:HPt (histidine-containing phosphotransfer) domain-containing protein
MNLLFRVLGRWLPARPEEAEADSSNESSDPVPSESAEMDKMLSSEGWPGIDLPRALARIRKPSLLRRLLRDFHRDFGEVPGQVKAAIRGGDREAALMAVHNLKGVAGNLSATGLFQAALELENALRHEANGDLPALVESFESAFFEVWNGAGAVFLAEGASFQMGGQGEKGEDGEEGGALGGSRKVDEDPAGGIPAETGRVLAVLMERLRAQDLAAEELAAEVRKLLSGTVYDAGAAALEARIGELDFEGAREALRSLAERLNLSVG